MIYNKVMINIFFEAIKLVFETFFSFFVNIVLATLSISNAVDEVKEGMIAAVLGVSVGAVSFVSLLIGLIKFVYDNLKRN